MTDLLHLKKIDQLKKGSSGATLTLLNNSFGRKIVRKSTSINFFKLIDQYKWLNEHRSLEFIPKVSNPIRNVHSFSYDLEYYESYQTLSEIVLKNGLERIKPVVHNILDLMEKYFYRFETSKINDEILEIYLNEKVLKKVQQCEGWNELYNPLFESKYLTINDKKYLNFRHLWKKIGQRNTLDKLSLSNQCEIHGDLTAENILVGNSGEVILLDPNQENYYSSIAVDLAKMFQSFNSEYELLSVVNDLKIDGSNIEYTVPKNKYYLEMFNFLQEESANMFDVENREILFHEAIHFARMLPYKIIDKEDNFPIYYCRMIILFNNVLNEL